jgi:23S rRNA (adenine2503-C2)-methyltransferase
MTHRSSGAASSGGGELPLIRCLSHAALAKRLKDMGEPAYRFEVLKQFLYREGADRFDSITPIPKVSRERLAELFDASLPEVAGRSVAPDGTVKLLLSWAGTTAEAVLMPSVKGRTLCLSVQSGCRLRCAFCATGTMGLKRNLSFGEILDQVLVLSGEGAVDRIVAMGMGEPMENLDELIPALEFITNPKGLGFSRKRITVSTVGLVPEMERFAREGPGVELAVSLHATEDKTRSIIVPINRKYPIARLLDTASLYSRRANAKVTIEYILLNEINDRDEDIERLGAFSRKYGFPVNLIRYNPVENLPFESSKRLDDFAKRLKEKAIAVTVRRSKGVAIHAACGQLAGTLGKS